MTFDGEEIPRPDVALEVLWGKRLFLSLEERAHVSNCMGVLKLIGYINPGDWTHVVLIYRAHVLNKDNE